VLAILSASGLSHFLSVPSSITQFMADHLVEPLKRYTFWVRTVVVDGGMREDIVLFVYPYFLSVIGFKGFFQTEYADLCHLINNVEAPSSECTIAMLTVYTYNQLTDHMGIGSMRCTYISSTITHRLQKSFA
jgi:hypothetical protein